MTWWTWAVLAGLGILALALGFSLYFHRQFSQGIGALIEAAQETLIRSGEMVWAEVFGGPMVQGARVLRLQEQSKAREELLEATKHSRFFFWKLWEEELISQETDLTDTQKTILNKEAEGLVESHLCRLYFSAYQLGLVFALREYWGPFAPEIALPRPHTKVLAQEKAGVLLRYHPWVKEVLRLHLQEQLAQLSLDLKKILAAQDAENHWLESLIKKAEDSLMDISLHALCHGVFQGLNKDKESQGKTPSQVNGHP